MYRAMDRVDRVLAINAYALNALNPAPMYPLIHVFDSILIAAQKVNKILFLIPCSILANDPSNCVLSVFLFLPVLERILCSPAAPTATPKGVEQRFTAD